MVTFDAPDGTRLAFHEVGEGDPLICLPGGPMTASSYLGDLGGLSAHRTLVRLDLRGTGESAVPADLTTYRCDRLVEDVEALRRHLRRERIDVLAHSAGAALAVLYAARHPDRIGRLALVTPSPRVVGIDVTDSDRRRLAERRRDEPWFPEAFAALERIWSGVGTDEDWAAIVPFTYGTWDAVSQAFATEQEALRNEDAAADYYAEGGPEPGTTRAALGRLESRVLLLAGEHDVALPPTCAAEYVRLFPDSELGVQPASGHYPWLDDPSRFTQTLAAFLTDHR